jgi:hypothetical protein
MNNIDSVSSKKQSFDILDDSREGQMKYENIKNRFLPFCFGREYRRHMCVNATTTYNK